MTALIRIDRSWAELDGRERSRSIRFCSRCGQPGGDNADNPDPFSRARVCPECGMGLLLSCVRDALPGVGASFAIVTSDMRVSAVSEAGERIFGFESDAVGTPFLDLVSSPMGDDSLARSVAQASLRPREPVVMPVRTSTGPPRIGTMAARISTCGPPRAALVTVEPSDFGRR
jgi:ribosomal protein S27AE